MNIKYKNLTLRAIEEQDIPILHKWSNQPYVQDIMGDIHFPSSLDYHKEWFNKLKGDKNNQRFAIEAPGEGLLPPFIIGLTTIINIDWRNRHAWHGVMLGDAEIRGKGYGMENLMTTMRYAFEELGMVRLDGQIMEYNEIPYKLYVGKCGWKEEGRKKNYWYRRGKFWDSIILGITREEYNEVVKRTNYWGK